MAERKINNYESKILADRTIEEEGYTPNKLGRTSTKFIWASCRFCGEPHRIRKGFFNKAGSACHKECRLKEQSISGSPFSDPKVREKSEKTNLERYGSKFSQSSKTIRKRISDGCKRPEVREKIRKTNLDKYGVENHSQSKTIRDKAKKTNINRYGVTNPAKNKKCIEKAKNTTLKKYGVTNINKDPALKAISVKTFNESISLNKTGRYNLINILRGKDFWDRLGEDGILLKTVCKEFCLDYQSVTARLVTEEFSQKYYDTYGFPTQQKQKELYSFVRDDGLEVIGNDRSVITPMELDVFVPSKKFAIEFNGSYWHSEAVLDSKEARNKHILKTKLCRKNGIRLLHIFELDWDQRSEQYKSFIRTILGYNTEKINARSCEITNDNRIDLIDLWHVQGSPHTCLKSFCLKHPEKGIVGIITAGRHHRQGFGKDIVLSRLCFGPGLNVRGGSSRLFKALKNWSKEEGYERIISWSDNTYTEGNIYNILGLLFKCIRIRPNTI